MGFDLELNIPYALQSDSGGYELVVRNPFGQDRTVPIQFTVQPSVPVVGRNAYFRMRAVGAMPMTY